jgi:hypothetical protein
MPGPQYTTCVNRKDYKNPNFDAETIIAATGLVFAFATGGLSLIASLFAAMAALLKVCEYILHGKLVCLGGEQCAIGRVTAFETVDDKKGLDKLDNDFSINMLLAPHDLPIFAQGGDQKTNYEIVANDGLQGNLIVEQQDMPEPREATSGKWHSPRYRPTFTTYPDRSYITYEPFLGSKGIPYDVPIFHCEIEGERARRVCETLHGLSGLGIPGVCGFKLGPIPIGKVICALVATALAPLIIAALIAAWILGSEDNRDVDGAGELRRGECILVRGRWVYDAGHQGWNEIHAVFSVQRIASTGCDWGNFQKEWDRWCQRTEEVPPQGTIGRPTLMTPAQEQVYDAQLRPENRWVFHPLIDGCSPEPEPPVIH